MKNQDIMLGAAWVALGLALTVLGCLVTLDEFWSAMGPTLMVIGGVRLFRGYRLSKSEAYREKMEVAASDERIQFIRSKAWAWAGYLFIFVCAVVTVVLRLLGQDMLCIAAAGAVCLMVTLYWVSYFILQKKY